MTVCITELVHHCNSMDDSKADYIPVLWRDTEGWGAVGFYEDRLNPINYCPYCGIELKPLSDALLAEKKSE